LVSFLAKYNQNQEELITNEKFMSLKKYLKLQNFETSKLIQLYYMEMSSLQMNLKKSDNGILYCTAYYNAKNETLIVESNIFLFK
jgi:hypothetical protein